MFSILSVDPEALVRDEQLGSKSKFWFARGDERWLFKFARKNTGEDWAEKIAAEVAYQLGIRAALVELADYRGQPGSASLSFVEPKENLVHGNEILAGHILGYDRDKRLRQSDHTLENVVRAVRKLVGDAAWYHEVLTDFAPYLVLDALICNTDRHHENWGFLMQTVPRGSRRFGLEFSLAPSFDHASSLGRELWADRAAKILAANGVAAYARRGRGGIYWKSTDAHGANPLELVERATAQFPEYFRNTLARVAGTPVSQLTALVEQVPGHRIAGPSREFAKALLTHTHAVLSGLAP